MAKFENCWRGLPYVVNRGGQKNFTQFMTFVKQELGELPDTWEPTSDSYRNYIAKAILFRDVQRFIRADESISAYRINVTAYTVSMLAEKSARRLNLDAIWKQQAIGEATSQVARAWAPTIYHELKAYAERQNVHIDNTLKSQACWEHLLSLDLKVPSSLEGELISALPASGQVKVVGKPTRSGDHLRPEDHNNVARCLELSPDQWMAIVTWGSRAGELEAWQLGIATTLGSYAAAGWSRTPSVKQAKHGAAMIDAARAAGVLN